MGIKKGEIWYTERYGSVSGAGRPVLVLSNEGQNIMSGGAVAAFLSTRANKRDYTHVKVHTKENRPFWAITGRITTITEERFTNKVGDVREEDMAKVEGALCKILDL